MQALALLVALFTGAWIETRLTGFPVLQALVALFTGAWIETTGYAPLSNKNMSRALYGRVD